MLADYQLLEPQLEESETQAWFISRAIQPFSRLSFRGIRVLWEILSISKQITYRSSEKCLMRQYWKLIFLALNKWTEDLKISDCWSVAENINANVDETVGGAGTWGCGGVWLCFLRSAPWPRRENRFLSFKDSDCPDQPFPRNSGQYSPKHPLTTFYLWNRHRSGIWTHTCKKSSNCNKFHSKNNRDEGLKQP